MHVYICYASQIRHRNFFGIETPDCSSVREESEILETEMVARVVEGRAL